MIFTDRNRQKASLINCIQNLKKDGKLFRVFSRESTNIRLHFIKLFLRDWKSNNVLGVVLHQRSDTKKVYSLTVNFINDEEGISKSTTKSFRSFIHNYGISSK